MRWSFQLCVVVLIVFGAVAAMGQSTTGKATSENSPGSLLEDEFDLDFLNPSLTDKNDKTSFQTVGLAPPGLFTVAVEINGISKGSMNIKFVRSSRLENAAPCFTAKDIRFFQLRTEMLSANAQALISPKAPAASQTNAATACLSLQALIEEASYEYDRGELALKITVPQAALEKQKADRIALSDFSDGENAGFVNYYANAYQSYGQSQGKSSQFLNLQSGFNIESWQLRQQSILSGTDGQALQRIDAGLSAKKVFRDWQAAVLLGKINSQTPLMAGVPVAGLRINSEEGLLPPEDRLYNPAIKGYARSNARVQARQNGLLFLERNVPPGPFDIDALRPPSSNGDIQVTVTEADGSQQVFMVPYANAVGRLNPGAFRYLVNLGTYDASPGKEQNLLQSSVRYGVTETWTAALDFLLADRYQSYATQFDWENSLGAQMFSVNVARAAANGNQPAYSLNYQNRFRPAKNFTLSYSLSARTDDYRDPAQALQSELPGQSSAPNSKATQALSGAVDLGQWGSLGLAHSVQSYWHSTQASESTQLTYSKNVFGASINFSLNTSNANNGVVDSGRMVSAYVGLFMPVSLGPGRASLSTSVSAQANANANTSINYQNNLENGFEFGLGLSGNNDSSVRSANVQAEHNWGYASASISQSSSGDRQFGLGNNGALVFHRGGVIAAPPLGETFGIVEVPGGAGARVLGQKSKLGGSGFGVAPYLSPYSSNTVELNLDEAPLDLEIASPTQSVVPMAGAIVRLKYEAFTGLPLLVDFRPVQIKNIPIGAEVTDEDNNNVGMVGQGSRAILRVKKPEGTLMISWGDSAKEKCLARYLVSNRDKPNAAGFIKFELPCVAP